MNSKSDLVYNIGMVKKKSEFVCQQCGATYAKWVGQCSNCGAWNSLVEQVAEPEVGKKSAIEKGRASGKKANLKGS